MASGLQCEATWALTCRETKVSCFARVIELDLQNFVNVHFRSKEMGQLMRAAGECGMLYFLYNEDIISVLVCHDIQQGEFVLQIPYYPAVHDFKKDFTLAKCHEMVKQSLLSHEVLKNHSNVDIDIINTNTWRMEGLVATRMQNRRKDPNIFLAGDSAHAFPPSGGFGMNAGIADAQNLAHKIKRSLDYHRGDLDAYEVERLHANQMMREFSVENY